MLDYGPPETENRERWRTAIALALMLQSCAAGIVFLAGVLAMSDDMGSDLSVRGWPLQVALVIALIVFLVSGLVAAKITRTKRAWWVALGPALVLLLAAALARIL